MSRLKSLSTLMHSPDNTEEREDGSIRLIQCPYQARMLSENTIKPCKIAVTIPNSCASCPVDEACVFNDRMEKIFYE